MRQLKYMDHPSKFSSSMKVILVLIVASLALATADHNQSKVWSMFSKMINKVVGEQKEELQELMQMKKTMMKVEIKND